MDWKISKFENKIEVTKKAIEKFVELGATDPSYVRITIVPGGCSGMTYKASIETKVNFDDRIVFDSLKDHFRVVTDPTSFPYLSGLSIDYSDDLIGAGFRFKNPTAHKSCGCGSSFSV